MAFSMLLAGCLAVVGYYFVRSIYRLYFHPLSKFPGPKLAAITHGYEFYYDAIKGGQFVWELQRLHEQYGPIVRINPRELHIKDSAAFDRIYIQRRQEKDKYMVNMFTCPTSAAATVEHDLHRSRREIVNPFFSKKAVMGLEYKVHDKVERVCEHLQTAYEAGSVVSVDGLFAALTADIISHYTYGESMGILDSKDLKNDFRESVAGAGALCHYTRMFPIIAASVDLMPGFIEWMQPGAKGLFDTKRWLDGMINNMIAEDSPRKPGAEKNIFDSILDKSLPPAERTPSRARDEAQTILAAGTETTARVLSIGCFHLYRDPSMLYKLREELRKVMPEPTTKVSWAQLEQLPYLTAVVNESLRLSHSVLIRVPRVSPSTAWEYEGYTIPPGTPVSQLMYFVHMDPAIFPDPETFNPDRWIEASNKGERLTKYLVPFTKGPRICLGLNLAYSELYQMIATMVRRFDLEIYNTTPESIRITRDIMIGLPDADKLEVHALVKDVIRA